MKSKSGSSHFNICPDALPALLSCPCSPVPASLLLFLPLHALSLFPLLLKSHSQALPGGLNAQKS